MNRPTSCHVCPRYSPVKGELLRGVCAALHHSRWTIADASIAPPETCPLPPAPVADLHLERPEAPATRREEQALADAEQQRARAKAAEEEAQGLRAKVTELEAKYQRSTAALLEASRLMRLSEAQAKQATLEARYVLTRAEDAKVALDTVTLERDELARTCEARGDVLKAAADLLGCDMGGDALPKAVQRLVEAARAVLSAAMEEDAEWSLAHSSDLDRLSAALPAQPKPAEPEVDDALLRDLYRAWRESEEGPIGGMGDVLRHLKTKGWRPPSGQGPAKE